MYIPRTVVISVLSLVLELVAGGILTAVGSLKCPPLTIKRGGVRLKSRGRIAKYTCLRGFQLLGERYSTCLRGRWDTPPPVCISNGCHIIDEDFPHGQLFESYRGALVKFHCDPGYSLVGSPALYCNGVSWNDTIPICKAEISAEAERQCDFESEDLCGWTQGLNHDFDWKRHSFATPSGHVGTGPTFDHTLGHGLDGHYMYLEASNPRLENDTARLFSPVFPAISNSDTCFIFWYHMYGANIGSLRVYLYTKSITLLFTKNGNQGNVWLRGTLPLPPLDTSFQIVIEGIRGAGYIGDTAIDDVKLTEGSECVEQLVTETSTTSQQENSFTNTIPSSGRTDLLEKRPVSVTFTNSVKFTSITTTTSLPKSLTSLTTNRPTLSTQNNNNKTNTLSVLQENSTKQYNSFSTTQRISLRSTLRTEIEKYPLSSYKTTLKPFNTTILNRISTPSNTVKKIYNHTLSSLKYTTLSLPKPSTKSPNITLTQKPTKFTIFIPKNKPLFKNISIVLQTPPTILFRSPQSRYTTQSTPKVQIKTSKPLVPTTLIPQRSIFPTKALQFHKELNSTKYNTSNPFWVKIKTPLPSIKIQQNMISDGEGIQKSKLSKTSNVKTYGNDYKIKGVQAQTILSSKKESAVGVVARIGLIALLIIVVCAAVTCYVRNRRINRRTNEDGEADVLFLTTDEYLDFRQARPSPERS